MENQYCKFFSMTTLDAKREKERAKIPRTVIMLGLVSLFTDAATEMIYPLIPVYVAALGSGAAILGIIEGFAETTASVLKLFSGYLSDRSGKRKLFVLAGYTVSTLFRPLTGLATAAWQIVFIRTADRIGKGLRSAPRDALIASSTDAAIRGKAFGFHRAMDHSGAVIGPILAVITLLSLFIFAGLKDPLSALRYTFILALVPGILAVLTIVFFVTEKSPGPVRKGFPVLTLRNFDPNFRLYVLSVILFTLGNSSDAFLLFRVEETIRQSGVVAEFVNSFEPLRKMLAGFGNETVRADIINILFLPFIWAYFHVIKVLFSTPMGALSDRIGRKRVISFGWAVYALVYAGFALLNFLPVRWHLPATFMLFGVYALYYAFTEGAEKAFVADLVSDEYRGTAYGVFNFATGLATLPASVLFGFLYSYTDRIIPGFGGTVAFSTGAMIATASIIFLNMRVRENKGFPGT